MEVNNFLTLEWEDVFCCSIFKVYITGKDFSKGQSITIHYTNLS